MKSFKDKVAVITGAASGIGLGLARKCTQLGMRTVLADIEEAALIKAESQLKAEGAQVIPVVVDISKIKDIQKLSRETLKAYGGVDLLFNNAGVATGQSIWESSLKDCEWVINVNLLGVLHSIREFVPIMLEQKTQSHIVNTSSLAGMASFHPCALYQLTKHGVVALSEQLHHDLAIRGANIKVSVLCPGFVNTSIMDSERNRPEQYIDAGIETEAPVEPDPMEAAFRQMVEDGMAPLKVADIVFEAIKNERFFIFTHPEIKEMVQARMGDILEERNPVLPPFELPK